MSEPWRGIFPPMVTPLRARDELDLPGLERLIEHILAGGVSGLFILGSTGEAPSLSYRLRRELITRACRQVGGRVPVLVGITDTSFVESVNLGQSAAEAGAKALVLSAPYYFPAGQGELLEYSKRIAAELPLPLFLYNLPSLTKIAFEPETVRRAMDIPKVIGLKDSSANMIYFHQLISLLPHRPDWTLLVGPEELVADAVLLGGHGGICAGANLRPKLYVELYEAAAGRDLDRVMDLHTQVIAASSKLYKARHSPAVIRGIKCALSCLGICDDFMAEPFESAGKEQRREVEEYLAGLGMSR